MSILRDIINQYNLMQSSYIDLYTYSYNDIEELDKVQIFNVGQATVARLMSDNTVTEKVAIDKPVIIDLNGHTLTLSSECINITADGELLIYNGNLCSYMDVHDSTSHIALTTISADESALFLGLINCKFYSTNSVTDYHVYEIYSGANDNLFCNVQVDLHYTGESISSACYRYGIVCLDTAHRSQLVNCRISVEGENTHLLNAVYLASKYNSIDNCSINTNQDRSDSSTTVFLKGGRNIVRDSIIHQNGTQLTDDCGSKPIAIYGKASNRSQTVLVNSDFYGRHSSAIFSAYSDVYVTDCTFSSPEHGVYLTASHPNYDCIENSEAIGYFNNCVFTHHIAERERAGCGGSGGMYCGYGATAYINNCQFKNPGGRGSSICFNQRDKAKSSSTVNISNCTFDTPIRSAGSTEAPDAVVKYSTLNVGEGIPSNAVVPCTNGQVRINYTDTVYSNKPEWLPSFVSDMSTLLNTVELVQAELNAYSSKYLHTPDSRLSVLTDALLKSKSNKLLNSDIIFRTSATPNLKLTGKGSIDIIRWNRVDTYQLTDVPTTIQLERYDSNEFIYNNVDKSEFSSLYTTMSDAFGILNADNITELDISNNNLYELIFNNHNKLNKLVIHNNNLTELDVTHCKELQFLHMFNNPICSDTNKMKAIIKQLPDRNGKAFGSIILYDWVNLGLCGYFNAADRLFYHDKEYKYPLRAYANEIYRDIASIEHPWYRYIDDKFVELVDYNKMIMLRRKLEGLDKSTWTYTNKEGSIFKNWVFGSAIQYNDEAWKHCDIPFRDSHVADVWETAEKGEGVGIASIDANDWIQPSINFNRVYAYSWVGFPDTAYDSTGGIAPVPVYTVEETIPYKVATMCPWVEPGCYKVKEAIISSVNDDHTGTLAVSDHGDCCYSYMGDRGITSVANMTYGIAPEARYYLAGCWSSGSGSLYWLNSTSNDWTRLVAKSAGVTDVSISNIYNQHMYKDSNISSVKLNDINLLTRSISQNYTEIPDTFKFHNLMNEKAFESILAFNSQANDGEGFPWTTDKNTTSRTAFIMSKNCNFVSSMNLLKHWSSYTTAAISDLPYTSNYSNYGESVRQYRTRLQAVRTGSGTSYATPIHTAMVSLIYVLYSKINNLYKFNMDDSKWFIETTAQNKNLLEQCMKKHIDPLRGQPHSVTGLGTIDYMCYDNYLYSSIKETIATMSSRNKKINEPLHIHRSCLMTSKQDIDDGFFVKSDITRVPMLHNHTQCVPLTSGEHNITVYNNNLNTIAQIDTLSGFTNDKSEGIYFSNVIFTAELNNVEHTAVSEGMLLETTDTRSTLNEFAECSNDSGWTISGAIRYDRPSNAGNTIRVFATDNCYILVSSSSEKVACYLYDNNGYLSNKDNDYTYLVLDYKSISSGRDRELGYLGLCNGTSNIWTLRKSSNSNIIDFFINGQYITSHTTLSEYTDTSTLIPVSVESGTSFINCISLCIHNRPLSDDEVIQQSLYMHQKYAQ